jgi:HSP90 family molecular chaperone
MSKVNFKIDTRLTSLLGENYRSSESAIKELVDNAWDADAENVKIILPDPFSQNPIIIEDDGTGMTKQEIENEYLFIANSRIIIKGEVTQLKKRKVKGRKGIGKFAGLVIAARMEIISCARNKKTILVIDNNEIQNYSKELEDVDLKITT